MNSFNSARGRRLPKWIDKKEWPKLIKAARLDASGAKKCEELAARDAALVALMLYTGMRVSEVCSLNLDSVSFTRDEERIDFIGKGDKERYTDLPKVPREAMQAYLKIRRKPRSGEGEPFFVSALGLRLCPRRVQKLMKEVGQRVGVPWLTPHKLRHSHAVELLDKTNNVMLVMNQLGHEDPSTTAIYAHVKDSRRRAALNKL